MSALANTFTPTMQFAPLDWARDGGAVSRLLAGDSRLLGALRSPSARVTVALDTAAVASWTPLSWDSEQFGFSAARLDVCAAEGDYATAFPAQRRLLRHVLNQCRRERICHLTTRTPPAALSTIHALERTGFQLLDGIQTFTVPVSGPTPNPVPGAPEFVIREFQERDLRSVLQIARSSFVHDRFHADVALGRGVADRINETWVRNCCLSQMADQVMVAEAAGTILGFVTCSIERERNRGVIGMVATSQSARRRGVARAITSQALQWFSANGAEIVEVGTQLVNVAAARLYQTCGFVTSALVLTHRRLL